MGKRYGMLLGKYILTPEEEARYRERCMPTPREMEIIMAVQDKRGIDTLPFEVTEEDRKYFQKIFEEYENFKKKTGRDMIFAFVNDSE